MWLNIVQLARNLLKDDQQLVSVTYFTALVRGNDHKRKRQLVYLDALRTLDSLNITLGKYQLSDFRCPKCNETSQVPAEKMTDVNISVAMLNDAMANRFDTALLVSGDGDLAPAVRAVRAPGLAKRVVVVFPPKRSAFELQKAADAWFTIGRRVLARSQFPDEVASRSGVSLRKPNRWR